MPSPPFLLLFMLAMTSLPIKADKSPNPAAISYSGCSLKQPLDCNSHSDSDIQMGECWSNARVMQQKSAFFVPFPPGHQSYNSEGGPYGDCTAFACYPEESDMQEESNLSNFCFFWDGKDHTVIPNGGLQRRGLYERDDTASAEPNASQNMTTTTTDPTAMGTTSTADPIAGATADPNNVLTTSTDPPADPTMNSSGTGKGKSKKIHKHKPKKMKKKKHHGHRGTHKKHKDSTGTDSTGTTDGANPPMGGAGSDATDPTAAGATSNGTTTDSTAGAMPGPTSDTGTAAADPTGTGGTNTGSTTDATSAPATDPTTDTTGTTPDPTANTGTDATDPNAAGATDTSTAPDPSTGTGTAAVDPNGTGTAINGTTTDATAAPATDPTTDTTSTIPDPTATTGTVATDPNAAGTTDTTASPATDPTTDTSGTAVTAAVGGSDGDVTASVSAGTGDSGTDSSETGASSLNGTASDYKNVKKSKLKKPKVKKPKTKKPKKVKKIKSPAPSGGTSGGNEGGGSSSSSSSSYTPPASTSELPKAPGTVVIPIPMVCPSNLENCYSANYFEPGGKLEVYANLIPTYEGLWFPPKRDHQFLFCKGLGLGCPSPTMRELQLQHIGDQHCDTSQCKVPPNSN